jgi:hypothetical protein
MNQWPCCFIDDGASPASQVLARTIATRRLEWGDTTGEYGVREGARLIRSEMEVGRPSEAPTRDRAVPLQRVWVWDQHDGRAPGLPDVWEASVGANPEATLLGHAGEAVSPTMLSFDEAKDSASS